MHIESKFHPQVQTLQQQAGNTTTTTTKGVASQPETLKSMKENAPRGTFFNEKTGKFEYTKLGKAIGVLKSTLDSYQQKFDKLKASQRSIFTAPFRAVGYLIGKIFGFIKYVLFLEFLSTSESKGTKATKS